MEWQFGIPTFSDYDEDGFLGIQVDVFGDGSSQSGCKSGELQTPYGFQCRPLDPVLGPDGEIDPTKSGQVMYGWKGGFLHTIPTQHPVIVKDLPQLLKGEAMVYGPAMNFSRYHLDGGITHFTTDDGTPEGNSVYDQTNPDGFMRVAPWGIERFDAMGYHLKTTSGALMRLGGIGGVPGLSVIGSYAVLQAASVKIDGSAVCLGSQLLPQQPVCLSIPVLAAFGEILVAMAALSTWAAANGTAMATIPTFIDPAKATYTAATTAFTTALTTLATALGATELLIPATSVTAS